MDKKELKEKIEEGSILTRIILEILGKPKEHVEKTAKDLEKQIKSLERLTVLSSEVASVEPQEEGLFSTFIETEILFKNIHHILDFTFNFMPSSVEILEPDKITMKTARFKDLIHDFIGKHHQVEAMAREIKAHNSIITKKMRIIIKNMIILGLRDGDKDIKTLCKMVGVDEKGIKPYLKELEEQNIITHSKSVYTMIGRLNV